MSAMIQEELRGNAAILFNLLWSLRTLIAANHVLLMFIREQRVCVQTQGPTFAEDLNNSFVGVFKSIKIISKLPFLPGLMLNAASLEAKCGSSRSFLSGKYFWRNIFVFTFC